MDAVQESSRIFVRNLPPTITEADFRKHFSRGHITDVKVLPQRRIGYVGFKTPEEARQAVKLFHRSFIRMSRISVEVAKPVCVRCHPTLEPPAADLLNQDSRSIPRQEQTLEEYPSRCADF